MNYYLPKITNGGISNSVKFKGIVKEKMTFSEREEIVKKNNIEWTKQQYESIGIEILDDFDDLFFKVSLPDGWTIRRDDGYWSSVLNEEGKPRISYFSKSAAWDPEAFSNFVRRYSYSIVPFDEYKGSDREKRRYSPWSLYITDGEERILLLEQFTPKTKDEYYEMDELLSKKARAYLDEHYPDWEDRNAYWSTPEPQKMSM